MYMLCACVCMCVYEWNHCIVLNIPSAGFFKVYHQIFAECNIWMKQILGHEMSKKACVKCSVTRKIWIEIVEE